nr:hypothetical protein [Mycoplasmopsis bovis]
MNQQQGKQTVALTTELIAVVACGVPEVNKVFSSIVSFNDLVLSSGCSLFQSIIPWKAPAIKSETAGEGTPPNAPIVRFSGWFL